LIELDTPNRIAPVVPQGRRHAVPAARRRAGALRLRARRTGCRPRCLVS